MHHSNIGQARAESTAQILAEQMLAERDTGLSRLSR
jgi:hypothetical protein